MRILAFDTATARDHGRAVRRSTTAPVEARDDPEPGDAAAAHDAADEPDRRGARPAAAAAGIGSTGSRSASARARSPGCGSGSPPARALARARGIALRRASRRSQSLALARGRVRASDGAVVAVLDARRGEVFAAVLARRPRPSARRRLLDPVALAPETLASAAARVGARRLAIGDGAVAFRAVLERSGAIDPRRPLEAALGSRHLPLPAGAWPRTGHRRRCPARVPPAPGRRALQRAAGTR